MKQSLASLLPHRPVGTFIELPTAASVEIAAQAGLDLVCIDAEHAPLGGREVQELIRAADAHGVPALVRVPELGPEIARVLDSGASGVLVPRIGSAAEAADAVRRACFPPEGRRGAGPGRASGYGSGLRGYLGDTSARPLVALQVETAEGVDAVEEICAVPGVDLIFIGPMDLSVSLGVEFGSAEHDRIIAAIIATAGRHGVATGIFCMAPDDVAASFSRGVDLVLASADTFALAAGARAIAQARAQLDAGTSVSNDTSGGQAKR